MQRWEVEKELEKIAKDKVKAKMLSGSGTARVETGTAAGATRILQNGDLRMQGRRASVSPWDDKGKEGWRMRELPEDEESDESCSEGDSIRWLR